MSDISQNVIIGAGISGLSCAYALRDRIVLEQKPFIGGLSTTFSFGEFRFDIGGHRFFTHDIAVAEFVDRLLLDETLEVNRKSTIYLDRSFIPYPLRLSVLFRLNPLQVASSVFMYLSRKLFPLKEASFRDRAINRFGDTLYGIFFRHYTEKVWGVDCRHLSSELVDARLQKVSLKDVVRHSFRRDRGIKTFQDRFTYPEKGIVKLAESLAKEVPVRCNAEVTGIVHDGQQIQKVIVNGIEEFRCRNLVSTMPLARLVEMLDAPPEVSEAAKKLRYRDLILVFLRLKRERFSKDHWIYFPGSQFFGRLHEPKNWSRSMAPAGETGICVEIFSSRGDRIWQMDNSEIAYQVIREMPLLDKFDVLDYCVKRIEYAYPIYDIHYKARRDTVMRYLSEFSNLFPVGRTGAFQYVNIDMCLAEGHVLGERLNALSSPRPRSADPAIENIADPVTR